MKKLSIALLLMLTCALLFGCVQDVPPTPAPDTTDDPVESTAPATDPSEPTTPADEETTAGTEEPTEPSPVALYQLVPEKNSLM